MVKNIYNPSLEQIIDQGENCATVVISPVYKGYGNTLANSLRRVLLSSIRGGAIVAVKFAGATHEFTTLDGIKEDLVDIILNLKNVHLLIHNDEPVEISIKKSGKGEILASDIKTNADVEVINPNQIIATIDDDKTSFEADLIAEAGRGYRSIEESAKQRLHSDMIAIDAFYSPILRVRYKVSDTRVGSETDLEKIELTITTDGTLTPVDAFEEAAAILVNQYQALAGSTSVKSDSLVESQEAEANSDLGVAIEDLQLSARTTNALINNDIKTVNDLISLSGQELQELKGFGQKALDEVKAKIAELEL